MMQTMVVIRNPPVLSDPVLQVALDKSVCQMTKCKSKCNTHEGFGGGGRCIEKVSLN